MRRLVASGKMTMAGLVKIRHHLKSTRGRSAEAWKVFSKFPVSYKRVRIGWIDAARLRPKAFRQRLRYFIRMTARNKRFGMT